MLPFKTGDTEISCLVLTAQQDGSVSIGGSISTGHGRETIHGKQATIVFHENGFGIRLKDRGNDLGTLIMGRRFVDKVKRQVQGQVALGI